MRASAKRAVTYTSSCVSRLPSTAARSGTHTLLPCPRYHYKLRGSAACPSLDHRRAAPMKAGHRPWSGLHLHARRALLSLPHTLTPNYHTWPCIYTDQPAGFCRTCRQIIEHTSKRSGEVVLGTSQVYNRAEPKLHLSRTPQPPSHGASPLASQHASLSMRSLKPGHRHLSLYHQQVDPAVGDRAHGGLK